MNQKKVISFKISKRNSCNGHIEVTFVLLSNNVAGIPFPPEFCVVLSQHEERRFNDGIGVILFTKLAPEGEVVTFFPRRSSPEFSACRELLRIRLEQSPKGSFYLEMWPDADARQLVGIVTMN